MAWDTPVGEVLPDFEHANKTINDKTTIVDYVSHRTGLAPENMPWLREFAGIELGRNETLRMLSYLETVFEFRRHWLYSN